MTKEISVPVDDMLIELRAALEAFRDEPCARALDAVFKETNNIATVCENEWVALEDEE